MFKCEYCGKEYKTERTYNQHINLYCKNKPKDEPKNEEKEDDFLEKSDEFVELVTKDVDIKEDTTIDIKDKLIKFFKNYNLENIHMNKDKLLEFKQLYKEYYGTELKKTCADGIVHAFSKLYYTTLKIKKERNE